MCKCGAYSFCSWPFAVPQRAACPSGLHLASGAYLVGSSSLALCLLVKPEVQTAAGWAGKKCRLLAPADL